MHSNSHVFCDPTKRHDILFIVDVIDGNPNGDPDSDNAPRQDQQTLQGLISDVCIKRKIRDCVEQICGEREGYRIYIQNDGIPLNTKLREANAATAEDLFPEPVEVGGAATRGKGKKPNGGTGTAETRREQGLKRCRWMYENFYDVRAFGAVMSTGDYPAGQVHGPIQVHIARSVDPVFPVDMSITRVSITREGEDKNTTSTMGRKWFIPYGLFVGTIHINPMFAMKSGLSSEDLSLFWSAFVRMWENDHSAARGRLGLHGLYIFSHESPHGNAPDHKLFEHIQVAKKPEVAYPRSIGDYVITVDEDMTDGVTLSRLVG